MRVCVCECVSPACHHANDTQNSLPPFSLEQHKEICVTMPTDQSARHPPPNPFWLPFPACFPIPKTTNIFNKCHKWWHTLYTFKCIWVQITGGIDFGVCRKCSLLASKWFPKMRLHQWEINRVVCNSWNVEIHGFCNCTQDRIREILSRYVLGSDLCSPFYPSCLIYTVTKK